MNAPATVLAGPGFDEPTLCYKVLAVLSLLKRPNAFVPVAISGAFLIAFAIGIAEGRLVRQPDEGTAAHLFQILMPAQLLIIAFFAISWLPQKPKAALQVLALQAAAALTVLAIVYLRHL